jgi:hypothetical protein
MTEPNDREQAQRVTGNSGWNGLLLDPRRPSRSSVRGRVTDEETVI